MGVRRSGMGIPESVVNSARRREDFCFARSSSSALQRSRLFSKEAIADGS
jgi:hypothetical protein